MTLAIIGGGPAGYAAAVSAAQQGRQVILIEQGQLGGTCLNEGCIPTKSLLESVNVLDKIKHAETFGITLSHGKITINWGNMQSRKQQVADQLVQGVQFLMKKNKIKTIQGTASFLSDRKLSIHREDGRKEIAEAEHVLIASGSEPASLPFAPFDGEWVINSKDALTLPDIPDSLMIIGGGVIGCEFAGLFGRLGTKVTIIEAADQLIPAEDADIARLFQEKLEEEGVEIHTSASLQRVDKAAKTVIYKSGGREAEAHADYVLIAIGRKPRISGLELEQAGISFSSSGIHVNEHMQTNIPHIYACGDAVGGIQLAHAAFHEGVIAASHASGRDVKVNERAVPRCIYTSPEIACIGMTEKQARREYGHVQIGEFPFSANGKALIKNQYSGKIKIITEPEFGEIIGVSMIGPDVTELIGQAAAMINGEMTVDMTEHFIAAHPTLSETLQEALLSTIGLAVHA